MVNALPDKGVPGEQVLAELREMRAADLPTHGGRLFAYVYDSAIDGLDDLAHRAYQVSAHVNGLDPAAFPSFLTMENALLTMENALVGAAARLLGGDAGVVGTVTGGGTESLLLAVKAARDARPDVAAPRLVIPSTAHPAFAKAGHYLRVTLDVVPVGPDLRADPAGTAAAIRPDTVLVVGSAPSYPHGVVDPVPQLAAIAAERGVRFHVDACFGGWVLPYFRRLGADLPGFDFSVPGVTSVSVDLHKYAYAPKGVSILLHRTEELRRPQYFAHASWPGYPMINSVVSSTRSGGPVAAALATLRTIGDAGYLELATRTRNAVSVLAEAVESTDGVHLYAAPETTVVCLAADPPHSTAVPLPTAAPPPPPPSTEPSGTPLLMRRSGELPRPGRGSAAERSAEPAEPAAGVDLFVLADELAVRGWHTQPQPAFGDLPPTLHLTVTATVSSTAAEFAPALVEAVAASRIRGPAQVPQALLEAAGALTPDLITADLIERLAGSLDLGTGGPTRMAAINTLLNMAPPAVREALLTGFLSLLQRPPPFTETRPPLVTATGVVPRATEPADPSP